METQQNKQPEPDWNTAPDWANDLITLKNLLTIYRYKIHLFIYKNLGK